MWLIKKYILADKVLNHEKTKWKTNQADFHFWIYYQYSYYNN